MRYVTAGLICLTLTAGSMQPAGAIGCLSGAALGGVAGHAVHHTFLGIFGGCAGGMVVHRMYAHWKVDHPNGTMSQFVEDNKDHLPHGWADKLSKLGDTHLKAGEQ